MQQLLAVTHLGAFPASGHAQILLVGVDRRPVRAFGDADLLVVKQCANRCRIGVLRGGEAAGLEVLPGRVNRFLRTRTVRANYTRGPALDPAGGADVGHWIGVGRGQDTAALWGIVAAASSKGTPGNALERYPTAE